MMERSEFLRSIAVFLFGALALAFLGCSSETEEQTSDADVGQTTPRYTEGAPTMTKPSGVRYKDLRIGTGQEITDSAYVQHAYTVWFAQGDGTQKGELHHSSAATGQQYLGQIGVTHMPSLSDGILGMREGGARRIFIPGEIAYPLSSPFGGRSLIFEIDSLKIVSAADVNEYQEHYNPKAFRDSILADRARKDSLAALGLDSLGQPLPEGSGGQ